MAARVGERGVTRNQKPSATRASLGCFAGGVSLARSAPLHVGIDNLAVSRKVFSKRLPDMGRKRGFRFALHLDQRLLGIVCNRRNDAGHTTLQTSNILHDVSTRAHVLSMLTVCITCVKLIQVIHLEGKEKAVRSGCSR